MVSISSKTLNENETARRAGIVVQPSDGRAGYVPDSFYGQPSSPVPRAPCPVPRAPCPVPRARQGAVQAHAGYAAVREDGQADVGAIA